MYLSTRSNLSLKTPRDSDSTTFLGSLFQHLATLPMKKFLLKPNLNLLWCNVRPFSHVPIYAVLFYRSFKCSQGTHYRPWIHPEILGHGKAFVVKAAEHLIKWEGQGELFVWLHDRGEREQCSCCWLWSSPEHHTHAPQNTSQQPAINRERTKNTNGNIHQEEGMWNYSHHTILGNLSDEKGWRRWSDTIPTEVNAETVPSLWLSWTELKIHIPRGENIYIIRRKMVFSQLLVTD